MTRRALLLPAAVLLLSACSGGGDGSEAEGVTKEQYVEQATAICDEAVEKRKALTRPTDAAGFAPFVDESVALAKDTATRLTALELPEADAEEIRTRLLAPLDALVSQAEAFGTKVRAAGTDQEALLPLLGQVPQPDPDALAFTKEYGLESCSEAAAPPS